MAEEHININVIIADRPYRLKIRPEEEEGIRAAAKRINEKVKEFQNVYEAKDKQDYLAMASILFAVDAENNKRPTKPTVDSAVAGKLEELNAHLQSILDESESSSE